MGLKGEYIVDDRVWVVKAHHPALLPMALKFGSSKVLCCIRNPLDIFPSFASLANTMSHSEQPEFKYHKDFPVWWDWWVKTQAECHARYFKTMIDDCTKNGKNPIYIVRYEDLVNDSKAEMEGVMKFLLDVDTLEGTNCMRRLEQMAAMGSKAGTSYKLKSTTGKFNVNAPMYTDAQMEFIKETNAEFLYLFGYSNHPNEENRTAFFNFDSHKPEHVEKYYGFRKINEDSIKKLVADGGTKGPTY